MKYATLMGGVFRDDVELPPEGFLLAHQRRRLVTLIVCIQRHIKSNGNRIVEDTVLRAAILQTPAYGMDPAHFFGYFFNPDGWRRRIVPEVTNHKFTFDDVMRDMPDQQLPNNCALTWKDLSQVAISSVAGSAMLHRTLSTAGQSPKWDPGDWDMFLVFDSSFRYLHAWANAVFQRTVYTGDLNMINPPVHNPSIFGRPMALPQLTTCKWTAGRIVINGTRLNKTQLCQFDVEACETCIVPPFREVYRSFTPGELYIIYTVDECSAPREIRGDEAKIELLRKRSRGRLAMYRRRLGRHNVVPVVDTQWKRTVWYDMAAFRNARMDLSNRVTKHIDTQQ